MHNQIKWHELFLQLHSLGLDIPNEVQVFNKNAKFLTGIGIFQSGSKYS